MKKENKTKLYLMFFVFSLFSCQNKDKIRINESQNIKDERIKKDIELIEDFNFDNHLDTLRIINRDSTNSDLVIYLFGSRNLLISKKVIFPKRKLYSEGSQGIIDLYYKKPTIILSQEYGSTSPEGWYICYINYNKITKKFIVDSIEHSWKNYKAKSDLDFIKSKTKKIKINLEDFNAESEFYNFNRK